MGQQVNVYRELTFFKDSGPTKLFNFNSDNSSSILYIRPQTDGTGSIYFGDGTKNADVRFYGNTSGAYIMWDESADQLCFVGGATTTIGTSGTPLSYTAGTPIFNLYATNAGTSSTNAEPFYVKSTLTGTGGYGGRCRFHTYSNVASGSNVMALKAYMEYGSSGTNNGLSAAFCAELAMPNANTGSGGVYTVLELEYVAGGSSTTTAGSLTGNHAQFIRATASGDTDGDFDDNGYFMVVSGLTAGAAHLLSTTSQTLKCGIGTTTRYLLLSQAADGLALGNSSTAQTYTAGTAPITCYFTAAGSGSTNCESVYIKNTLTGTSPVGGRAQFYCYANVTCGSWVNALKGYMQFDTSGKVTGLASAICAEMAIPNVNLGSGGAYAPLEVELVYGGTSVVSAGGLSGNHVAFATYRFSGDTDGDFDDNGFLFTLTGLTSGANHLFYANKSVPFDAYLKIGVGTATYYIGLLAQQAAAT